MKIIKLFETAKDNGNKLREIPARERSPENKKNHACTIRINASETFQQIEGFGAALTESSGYALSLIPAEKRKEALDAHFSADGSGYTLARTHMNSCDFSLENWACVEKEDETLASFSMERTDKYITPLLKEARDITGGALKLMISPWSPPTWMKENRCMNHGGKLIKTYYPLWSSYFIRFIGELKKREIDTWAVTVQNEPAAVQTWDSCEWTASEEGEFAVFHLGPALKKYASVTGKRIKLLVWDHNREILFDRFSESMAVTEADNFIDGAAFHWYSGDQYDQLAKTLKAYPGKMMVFSEGCIEGGPRPGAWFSGERYAHNIINDLNNGCTGWIDWNIALDTQGGPNHVGNFCDSPLLVDTEKGELHFGSSYYYIGHFSRFIRPQAVRLGFKKTDSYMMPASVDGKLGNMAECSVFKNNDCSIVMVIMNRTEADLVYDIGFGDKETIVVKCPPRGIQTLVLGEK